MSKKNKKRKSVFDKSVGATLVTGSSIPFNSLSQKVSKNTYTYRGAKNTTTFPEFVDLCKKTQLQLKELLPEKLLEVGYNDVVVGDGYIYAKGDTPVLLTAHMDTVHKQPVEEFYEYVDKDGNHIISALQGIGGDDRCGIYMILEIIKEHKCSVLFCEDEEIGGVGSDKFCETEFIKELSELKYLIELDRANKNDAVFYDCDNPEFTSFICENTGFKDTFGTFSDISNLAPACGVAAVNLSCGYYHAHTLQEEVVVEEMLHTIEVVKKLLTLECEKFEYVEKKHTPFGYGYYGYGYGRYNDYDDDWYSDYYSGKHKNKKDPGYEDQLQTILYVTYIDEMTGEEVMDSSCATTEEKAWLYFFQNNPNVCWNAVLDFDVDFV